jgi:mannosyltransferase OCH1-like enzyme
MRIDRWKELHPSFQYILWDKAKCREFIKEHFNFFLPIYDGYQYNVQRADSIRYFILYHYGGVYSDIDLEPYKCIESLLVRCDSKNCVLYRSPNSDKITNDFMICKPRCFFWKKIFKEMIINHDLDYISKHLTVMYSTGPLLLDYIYNRCKLRKNYIYIINAKYINNCDVSEEKPARNDEAYLIRWEGNTWHATDSSIINFIYTYCSHIVLIIIIITLFYNTPL